MSRGPVRMVLAGGGTGGHVYPAIAISQIARRALGEVELLFVGVRGRAEEHIVPRASIRIEYVHVRGLERNPLRLPGFVTTLARGWREARRILVGFDPHIVVSTGGFSSAPAVLAAASLRRSGRPALFVHEQNALPGRMNRVAGRLADRVGTTFESSNRFFPAGKVVHTGYPVRRSISGADRTQARRSLGVPDDAFVLLAFGGSGGARSINRGIVEALPLLLDVPGVHVIHGTGRYFGDDYDPGEDTARRVEALGLDPGKAGRYHPVPYIENMGEAYAACDLVVCRAGAGTLSELRAARVPAVLVPKIGLPHEHQLANARDMESKKCAWLIVEQDDSREPGAKRLPRGELWGKVRGIVQDRSLLDGVRASLGHEAVPDTEAMIGRILAEIL